MNKAQLIKHMIVKYKCSEEEAYRIINVFTGSVIDILKSGDNVALTNFGKFRINQMKARLGRNPKTMEQVQIESRNVVRFTVGKLLRDACNPDNIKVKKKYKKTSSKPVNKNK